MKGSAARCSCRFCVWHDDKLHHPTAFACLEVAGGGAGVLNLCVEGIKLRIEREYLCQLSEMAVLL